MTTANATTSSSMESSSIALHSTETNVQNPTIPVHINENQVNFYRPASPVAYTCIERIQLEDYTRFSTCHLWKLMQSFYETQGVESWAQGIVPHFITSNTFIAKRYVQVLQGYFRDFMKSMTLNPKEDFYIIELGTGSGKFSFYFLKALVAMEKLLEFPLSRIKYVMTDFTQRNFEFWKSHPTLKPYIDRGILDFAIFDASKDTKLELYLSKTVLNPGTLYNPIGIIANYLFDTLAHDLFQISDGLLKEGLISVGAKGKKTEPNPLDPEIIKRLANLYQYNPIEASYYGENQPHLNAILQWYHKYYTTVKAHRQYGNSTVNGATFLVPIGALSAIERLSALPKEQGVVILSGDKGNSNPEHFRGQSDPHIAVHGSFSVMVNYHAIGIYVTSRGGFAMHSPQEEASLKVSVFVLPNIKTKSNDIMKELFYEPTTLETLCNARSSECVYLTDAFQQSIIEFGPNDFFMLQKSMREETKVSCPSLKSVLALVKLSDWDPDVFYKFREVFLDQSPNCPLKLRQDVLYALPKVWNNYYLLDKEKDVAFEMGRLYYGLHEFDLALQYYTQSREELGSHHVTAHNMGLCYYSKHQLESAIPCFEEAYRLNSNYQKALTWLQRVRRELGITTPAPSSPTIEKQKSSGLTNIDDRRNSYDITMQQIELVLSDHEEECASTSRRGKTQPIIPGELARDVIVPPPAETS